MKTLHTWRICASRLRLPLRSAEQRYQQCRGVIAPATRPIDTGTGPVDDPEQSIRERAALRRHDPAPGMLVLGGAREVKLPHGLRPRARRTSGSKSGCRLRRTRSEQEDLWTGCGTVSNWNIRRNPCKSRYSLEQRRELISSVGQRRFWLPRH